MPHIADRRKRQAILSSTRLMPKALRVRAREELLGRLEIGKARRARFFLIGHPKSGNTWLRTMISRLYQVRYGLPASLVLKSDELALANAEIPRFFATNGHYSYEGVIKRAFLDPDGEFRDRRVILLIRHPCDIAVSWYLQFTKRISPAKRELINATLREPVDWRTISMWDFVMHSEIGLASLIDFLNGWYAIVSELDHWTLVRYEELRHRTKETLSAVVSFFGLPFTEEQIDEAVSFGSFENLSRLEGQGFFRRGGMALVRPNDPESRKVRRGKVGGYRDYFEPGQVAEMEALVSSRLLPVFGYGPVAAGGESAEGAV